MPGSCLTFAIQSEEAGFDKHRVKKKMTRGLPPAVAKKTAVAPCAGSFLLSLHTPVVLAVIGRGLQGAFLSQGRQ